MATSDDAHALSTAVLERLADRIDALGRRVDDNKSLLGEVARAHAVLESRVTALAVTVGQIRQDIYLGNGHGPLLTRLTDIEANRLRDRDVLARLGDRVEQHIAGHADQAKADLATGKGHTQWMIGLIASIVLGAATIVATILLD